MNESEYIELGLYDPEAPDASERLEILRLAFEHGATVDEVRQAIEERRLHVLAADRYSLGGHERLTLAEVAERAGVDLDFAERVWRALGFAMAGDERVCTERDVAVLRVHVESRAVFGEAQALAMARTAGGGLARNADAIVGVVRSNLEAPMRAGGSGDDAIAQIFVDVAQQFLPAIYPMFETVHRRHLVEAVRRYALWGVAPSAESTTTGVVGFADVVGSTQLGNELPPDELDQLLRTFEIRALDVTTGPGSRLVKMIGDEVLFVARDAGEAARIACGLLDDESLPKLRVGLAGGEIITRDGDVYGSVVNLASRIVASADPDEARVDPAVADALGPDAVAPVGPQSFKGFSEPVEVFTLRR